MSSSVPPASSNAALRFSHTSRVCASISPMPAIEPSARRAVMPEMNTGVPSAATAVAWEKWPLGWRSFFETICCLAMGSSYCISAAMKTHGARMRRSPGVRFVGVPGRRLGIMRAVIDFEHDGLLVRDRRPVHIAFRVAIERAGREHHARARIFVAAGKAEHELVRRVIVRRRDAGALGEPDERDRRAGGLVAPQHFFGNAAERLLPPRHVPALDENFLETWRARRKLHHCGLERRRLTPPPGAAGVDGRCRKARGAAIADRARPAWRRNRWTRRPRRGQRASGARARGLRPRPQARRRCFRTRSPPARPPWRARARNG